MSIEKDNKVSEILFHTFLYLNSDFQYPSYIKSNDGQHSGDDVGIFANGPYAHLFTGVLQQSSIPHLMAYAACIGNGPTMCDEN